MPVQYNWKGDQSLVAHGTKLIKEACHFTVKNAHKVIIEFLITKWTKVNVKNDAKKTPADAATEFGKTEIGALLLLSFKTFLH